MNVKPEVDRLFAQVFPSIPKPHELGACELDAQRNEAKNRMIRQTLENLAMAMAPIDPVDADETDNGICAQGDCSDE